ncbi:M81 family metallopeptidase [Mariniluteicoccus endophyticus]
MTRIVVGGFLHETNTFAPTPADWDNFVNGEGFPRMHRGEELYELRSVNIPVGGFLDEADPFWEIIPTIWCAASPSGPVTEAAYEQVAEIIVSACRDEHPDAVYLDLHGAMVTEHADDGDGELVRRVREVVGPDVPVVVSLDLHANISDSMLEQADAMVAYRTYPHVDMADTGRRTAHLLAALLRGERLHHAARKPDFLIPINSGSTLLSPCRELYAAIEELETDGTVLTLAAGFPAADIPDCGPCIFGYGPDATAVERAVDKLADLVAAREGDLRLDALPAADAVARAVELVSEGVRPVVIADTQDNPGAGGDATTTGLLGHLLEADPERTVLGALWAPEVVEQALTAGIGSEIEVTLQGSASRGDGPLTATFEVVSDSPGAIVFDGPMMHGNRLQVGPSCVLRRGNVSVVVNSRKAQIMDRNQIREAGIAPEEQDIVAVKSSVHFRGDFQPMAGAVLVAVAPGPMAADPADLAWTRLRPGIRLGPLGPAFVPRD